MRQDFHFQLEFGQVSIAKIQFDPQSRDEMPQVLRGLQHLFLDKKCRAEAFTLLRKVVPAATSLFDGRPGMSLWEILVLGIVRLNLNWDYDRLLDEMNYHQQLRQILACPRSASYRRQTVMDNLRLLTPAILGELSALAVRAGHKVMNVGKKPLQGRCDSFVTKTNVDFPTDIDLLFDAAQSILRLAANLARDHGAAGFRNAKSTVKKLKKACRTAQQAKGRGEPDEAGRKRLLAAYEVYLALATAEVMKALDLIQPLRGRYPEETRFDQVDEYVVDVTRQVDQIRRRVFREEKIPHAEKVFSVFEKHTEWICKGKAGVPFELGVRVGLVEDQYGFILSHRVMYRETDDKVAVALVEAALKSHPALEQCSFDKGFHSPANQEALKGILKRVVLPKKGKPNAAEREREAAEEFVEARRKHAAVESAINALKVHGLDQCPDKGKQGFDRYVALAVLARNVQQLGAILRKQEERRRQREERKAARQNLKNGRRPKAA